VNYAAPTQEDRDHLRLLSIFHYVAGGLLGAMACFGLIYVVLGLAFAFAPASAFGSHRGGGPPPAFFGLLFTLMGGLFLAIGWALAALLIFAGRSLAQYQRHTFCLVVAAISCLWMPFGTVLGVFTIIVLMRPGVQALFGRPALTP
jgi:hypothetical protein